ncbi:Riboflavin synthase [Candidatus Magnetomoraceae bacterium gMMP-15]
MFTGIIEGLGTLNAIKKSGQGMRLAIMSDFKLNETKLGDSIAINGACLTVVKLEARLFEVDLAPETFSITTFNQAKPGNRVNLERAMSFSSRIDGHLVSGHVDGTGKILSKQNLDNAIIIKIGVNPELCRCMIQKGSAAVDGISLTINQVGKDFFELSIIPHTAKLTTIGFKKAGDSVNIETDLIGKYVEKFVSLMNNKDNKRKEISRNSSINMEFLGEKGFL